jgi:hypothetical protein
MFVYVFVVVEHVVDFSDLTVLSLKKSGIFNSLIGIG